MFRRAISGWIRPFFEKIHFAALEKKFWRYVLLSYLETIGAMSSTILWKREVEKNTQNFFRIVLVHHDPLIGRQMTLIGGQSVPFISFSHCYHFREPVSKGTLRKWSDSYVFTSIKWFLNWKSADNCFGQRNRVGVIEMRFSRHGTYLNPFQCSSKTEKFFLQTEYQKYKEDWRFRLHFPITNYP